MQLKNLGLGANSALSRFFNAHLVTPLLKGCDIHAEILDPVVAKAVQQAWEQVDTTDGRAIGVEFYQRLFESVPEALEFFAHTDMDGLSAHFSRTLELLVQTMYEFRSIHPALVDLGQLHRKLGIPSAVYPLLFPPLAETLVHTLGEAWEDEMAGVWKLLYDRAAAVLAAPSVYDERLAAEAKKYLRSVAKELSWEDETLAKRIAEVEHEIKLTGTYTHSYVAALSTPFPATLPVNLSSAIFPC